MTITIVAAPVEPKRMPPADLISTALAQPLASVPPEVEFVPVAIAEVAPAQRVSAVPARRQLSQRMTVDLLCVMAAMGLVSATSASLTVAEALAIPAVWLMLLTLSSAYQTGVTSSRAWTRGTLRAAGLFGLICWVLTTLTGVASSSTLLLLTLGLTAISLSSQGLVYLWNAQRDSSQLDIVLTGELSQVRTTLEDLSRRPRPGLRVSAVCLLSEPEQAPAHLAGVPVTYGLEQLPALAATVGGAVIVLNHTTIEPSRLRFLSWSLEATGTDLYLGTGLVDTSPARTRAAEAGGLHLLRIGSTATRSNPARLTKIALEWLAATAGVVVLLPALGVLAALIRVTSSGPAIFTQTRIGRDGQPFTMFKFRTMSTDAEATIEELDDNDADFDGVLFKLREDPRITSIGKILRRYSLDELPQLFNVVLGQMALVGPRPALPGEVERYDHAPRRRLVVRPGLTGLWQVSGRSDLSWDESVRLDLSYVDNWSLALDLSILRRTVRAVCGHHGAY